MSIDLYLYSKVTPSRKAIENIVFPLGFEPVDDQEERWYWWFKDDNYESFRGCRLYVSRSDGTDTGLPRGAKTIFHSYTNAGRSREDLDMQNNVIRTLRSHFGGSVYDPQEGKYAYLPNDIPKLSVAEKRCGFVYGRFHNNLGMATMAVSDLNPQFSKMKHIFDDMDYYDKNVLTNNLVIVFLVSILEVFLKDLFVSYVETQPVVQEKIYAKTSKIDYPTLRELLERKRSLAEVEADLYTFQNISSANVAFNTYMNINLFNVWDRKKKIDRKFYNVREGIIELLSLRHKIIHTAYIDTDIDRRKLVRYHTIVRGAGNLIVESLEKQGFRIDLEKYI